MRRQVWKRSGERAIRRNFGGPVVTASDSTSAMRGT